MGAWASLFKISIFQIDKTLYFHSLSSNSNNSMFATTAHLAHKNCQRREDRMRDERRRALDTNPVLKECWTLVIKFLDDDPKQAISITRIFERMDKDKSGG